MMGFEGLVQVGINNVIICKANGHEMGVHELRLIDQFAKTTYVSLRLQELLISKELDQHEKTGRYQDKDSLDDPETTGDGDHHPCSEV